MRQLNCQLAGEGDDIYLSCCPVCVPCPWRTVRRVLCCEKWNKYLRWALSSANVLQLRDMYVHAELKWYRAVVSHFSWTGGTFSGQQKEHIQWPLHGDMVSWLSGPISKYINIINCLSYIGLWMIKVVVTHQTRSLLHHTYKMWNVTTKIYDSIAPTTVIELWFLSEHMR